MRRFDSSITLTAAFCVCRTCLGAQRRSANVLYQNKKCRLAASTTSARMTSAGTWIITTRPVRRCVLHLLCDDCRSIVARRLRRHIVRSFALERVEFCVDLVDRFVVRRWFRDSLCARDHTSIDCIDCCKRRQSSQARPSGGGLRSARAATAQEAETVAGNQRGAGKDFH